MLIASDRWREGTAKPVEKEMKAQNFKPRIYSTNVLFMYLVLILFAGVGWYLKGNPPKALPWVPDVLAYGIPILLVLAACNDLGIGKYYQVSNQRHLV